MGWGGGKHQSYVMLWCVTRGVPRYVCRKNSQLGCSYVCSKSLRNRRRRISHGFQTRNSRFQTRSSNFQTRNSRNQTRNSTFQTRNSNFQTRSSNIQTRNSRFQTRNSTFQTRNSLLELKLHSLNTGWSICAI